MFLTYIAEERILSNYNETVGDDKLPYFEDEKGKTKHQPVVTPVIILGYMRSGSSLTGDILQQNSQVFYVFEPLRDLQKDYFNTMDEIFPHIQIRQRSPTYEFKEDALHLFRAWFACDMKYILSDKNRYHLNFFKYGNKTNRLVECVERSAKETNSKSRFCTRLLRKECLKSKFRIVKTIRTRLIWLTDLLSEFQNLKVIHLVRDPRAIINSQIKYGECADKHGGVQGCTHNLCTNIEDDVTAFDLLDSLHPDRLQRISFEDLASKPVEVTKHIYKFIGMNLDAAAEGYVRNITSAGRNSTGVLSTVRANSSDIVDAWRAGISDETLFTVQTICRYAMEMLGLYHFIKP